MKWFKEKELDQSLFACSAEEPIASIALRLRGAVVVELNLDELLSNANYLKILFPSFN